MPNKEAIRELITDPNLLEAWEKYADDRLNADLAPEGLQEVMINPAHLIAYADNPNVHDQDSLSVILHSVKNHGFKNVVLVMPDAVIIYGHGRADSAIKAEKELIPVLIAIDLTLAQAATLRIADNASARYSHFDDSILSRELKRLDEQDIDLTITALRSDQIALALSDIGNPLAGDDLFPADGGPMAGTSEASGESCSTRDGMEENWVVYLTFGSLESAQNWLKTSLGAGVAESQAL